MTWLHQQTHTNTVSSYKACPIFLIYFCFIMQKGLCSCSVFLLSIIYQCSSLSLQRDSAPESVSVTHQSIPGQPCGQNLKNMCLFVSWIVDKYEKWVVSHVTPEVIEVKKSNLLVLLRPTWKTQIVAKKKNWWNQCSLLFISASF